MCQSTKVSISNKTQNTDLNVVGVLDNVRYMYYFLFFFNKINIQTTLSLKLRLFTLNVNGWDKKYVIITVPSLLIIVSTIEICRISW